MSLEDDFWAVVTRTVDRMCEVCPDCKTRKLKEQACDTCSRPPRGGLLPAKPLQLELASRQKIEDLSWEELGRRSHLSPRTILRVMAADWVTIKVADMICTALRIHPTQLWPTEWARL